MELSRSVDDEDDKNDARKDDLYNKDTISSFQFQQPVQSYFIPHYFAKENNLLSSQ